MEYSTEQEGSDLFLQPAEKVERQGKKRKQQEEKLLLSASSTPVATGELQFSKC